jgi:hypothetical protein
VTVIVADPTELPPDVSSAEFTGPFASWKNLKTDFGAVCDGVHDDTAAFQAAFNAAATSTGEIKFVLFIPAGTCLISKNLSFKASKGGQVYGEDPTRTIIRWTGPAGGTMITTYAASQSRFARITWDGNFKAATLFEISTVGMFYSTNQSVMDSIFENTAPGGVGVQIGRPNTPAGPSEVTITRSRFLKNGTGVQTGDFNALNIWVWNSEFTDCGIGISNTGKQEDGAQFAGNWFSFRNFFQRSTIADLMIGNTIPAAARWNTSIGSKKFIQVAQTAGPNFSPTTLQGNTILDVGSPAITLGAQVGIIAFDNVIKSAKGQTGAVIQINNFLPNNAVVSVNNTFTVANPINTINMALRSIGDKVVPPESVPIPRLPRVVFTPKVSRNVTNLANTATASDIQYAIASACRSFAGNHPVIHLGPGDYHLDSTIHVPANCDVFMLGDLGATRLFWSGPAGEVMFHLHGPSKAEFEDFYVYGGNKVGTVFLGDNADSPGGRVFINMGFHMGRDHVLDVDGVNHLRVESRGVWYFDNGYWNNYTAPSSQVRMKGGGAVEEAMLGVFGATFTGARADHDLSSFSVENGGRMLVQDGWFEGQQKYTVHLTSAAGPTARLTLSTFHLGPYYCNPAVGCPAPLVPNEVNDVPVLFFEGFSGTANLLGVASDKRPITVSGGDPTINILEYSVQKIAGKWLDAAVGDISHLMSYITQGPNFNGTGYLPGSMADARILDSISDMRILIPREFQHTPQQRTNLRFEHLIIEDVAGQSFHFTK